MTIPALTDEQLDAAALVRAIDILNRFNRTRIARVTLKRIAKQLAKGK